MRNRKTAVKKQTVTVEPLLAAAQLRLCRNRACTGQKAQTAPVVLIMTAILTIFAMALLGLFRYDTQRMAMRACMADKDELAQSAIDHALFKLQAGTNWDNIPANFIGYSNEFSTSFGTYTMHITKGNFFMTGLSAPYPIRQNETSDRTIGIKVKTLSGCTGMYVGVVRKVGFGGPIVSRGNINAPTDPSSNNDADFEVYWGDIYSANTNTGYCSLPAVPVGDGNHHPQDWKPQVYSAADIYTAYSSVTSGRTATIMYQSTYMDMTPSANCHPYSSYANAPDIDFEYYKGLAKRNTHAGVGGAAGAYYGPANVPGLGANPYYIDASHVSSQVTNTNIATLVSQLQSISPPDVLFIDTTDGLPLRASPCNAYCGHIANTANDGSDGTLRWYKDDTHQYYSKGLLFIMGPLVLAGDDPDNDSHNPPNSTDLASVVTGCPDNFYFPRQESNEHFYYVAGNTATSYLGNVTHQGLIYSGGQLQLGGTVASTTNPSNIAVYGSIYIGELGTLTTYDLNSTNYIYYNPSINVFGYSGSRVQLVTFSEITFLVPTPVPGYPTSF